MKSVLLAAIAALAVSGDAAAAPKKHHPAASADRDAQSPLFKAFAAARSKAFTLRDEFADEPSRSPFSGLAFDITAPTVETCCGITWSYDRSVGAVIVEFRSISAGSDKIQIRNYRGREHDYGATNGFGAVADVHSSDDLFYILDSKLPDVRVHVSGENARSLVRNLTVRLRGIIEDTDQPVVCTSEHHSPTFDDPFDMTLRSCVAKVKLAGVSLLSGSREIWSADAAQIGATLQTRKQMFDITANGLPLGEEEMAAFCAKAGISAEYC